MRSYTCLLFFLFFGGARPHAQAIQVFSRYNYYLPGDSQSIIGVLRDTGDRWVVSGDTFSGRVITVPLNLTTTGSVPWQLVREGHADTSGTVSIIVLPPRANAVQIDRLTGGLIADRMPFFPFGFYCTPVGDLPEREVVHGFNMIGPYQSNLPGGRPERRAYMDRCAQLGMRVQYSVNSLIGSGHNGARGLDMSDADKLALLKEEVLAFRDHPALLSWYINDEPDGQGLPPAILEAAYQVIHQLDPYHPISIVLMMPTKAADFRHSMDIAMTDPYPIPGPADEVMHYLDVYNKAYRYDKSVWLVPQAFGGQEMWEREPTAQEIRLMTYMGLISGVKGIQYYVHAAGNANPQSVSAWSACSDLAVETAQMSMFLLSAEQAPAAHTDDGKVLVRAFRYKGNILVLAANNENRPKPLHLQVADTCRSATGRSAECWFENRTVPMSNGQLGDIIDAYGTRAYLIRGAAPPDDSLLLPGNLTRNPSFEKIVSPGLPIGSNTTHTSRRLADPGATFFADPRQSVEGLFSLRLITPVDSGGDKIRLVPMVLTRGNSYTVSVWAKAKAATAMPALRLTLDQDHTYTLTDRWEKYGFTFTASSSSTNAILSFDLVTAGTAWIDLLQVAPDPVISYSMGPDHVATVEIRSATAVARSAMDVIRYSLDKLPDPSSPLVHGPLILRKAATVYAGIFAGDRLIGASQVFVPVNLALGKGVVLATPFDPHYPAGGNGSLTDGIMGTTAFKDGRWLGFNGPDLNATIDLSSGVTVRTATASFLCDPNSGIFLPPLVSVYTSADGQHFSWAGETRDTSGNPRGEPFLQRVRIRVGRNARYVRVVAKGFGAIPEGYLFTGTMSWLFCDELLVE